jgi:hypothetical protein
VLPRVSQPELFQAAAAFPYLAMTSGDWVKIHDHATLGIARRADPGAMMVKATGEQAWPEGDVDLLGHLF